MTGDKNVLEVILILDKAEYCAKATNNRRPYSGGGDPQEATHKGGDPQKLLWVASLEATHMWVAS